MLGLSPIFGNARCALGSAAVFLSFQMDVSSEAGVTMKAGAEGELSGARFTSRAAQRSTTGGEAGARSTIAARVRFDQVNAAEAMPFIDVRTEAAVAIAKGAEAISRLHPAVASIPTITLGAEADARARPVATLAVDAYADGSADGAGLRITADATGRLQLDSDGAAGIRIASRFTVETDARATGDIRNSMISRAFDQITGAAEAHADTRIAAVTTVDFPSKGEFPTGIRIAAAEYQLSTLSGDGAAEFRPQAEARASVQLAGEAVHMVETQGISQLAADADGESGFGARITAAAEFRGGFAVEYAIAARLRADVRLQAIPAEPRTIGDPGDKRAVAFAVPGADIHQSTAPGATAHTYHVAGAVATSYHPEPEE